jgi:hypothetical protein
MFELGDAAGDELARTSADGATWTEPSLMQQGRPAIAAELEADARAAELLEHHRATLAANAPPACPWGHAYCTVHTQRMACRYDVEHTGPCPFGERACTDHAHHELAQRDELDPMRLGE